VIEHPVTREIVTFTAPLPPHMQRTWEFVGWDADAAPLDPFAPPE